jgi:acetolactate decarboxylase
MKHPIRCRSFLWLILALALRAGGLVAGETLVQVSIIDSLLQGNYEGVATIGDLGKRGDFGLGTLEDLDGELLALDGVFYQITGDGRVHVVPPDATTPFAMVTFFRGKNSRRLDQPVASYAELKGVLDRRLPSANVFYAVRVTGAFGRMKVRSVPRQKPPFRPLTEVVREQALFEMENVEGTLVGFRSPAFSRGFTVPGYHFHFLSADGTRGGHVLEFSMEQGSVAWDGLDRFDVLLPGNETFLKADFMDHDAEGLRAVEVNPADR